MPRTPELTASFTARVTNMRDVNQHLSFALAVMRCPTGETGIVTDPEDETKWTTFHFSQSNPLGEGQGSVPALLRRVADSIDRLGDVDVHDLVFRSVVAADEDDLTITVYYDQTPRRR